MIKSKRIAVAAMARCLLSPVLLAEVTIPSLTSQPPRRKPLKKPAAEEEAAEEPAEEAAHSSVSHSIPVAVETVPSTTWQAKGRTTLRANLSIAVQELEATSDQDRQPNLEALAAAGNKLVVAVGFAFGDALGPIAEANPDVYFGWIDGYYDGANIITTAFSEQEGSFLVGAAAALKSQTGKIGFIGGQEIDLIKRFEAGYIAGAKAVNPDIVVESAYLGAAGDNAAWGSPDKAKEIAGAWYADGADVVYTAAGGSGRGMIGRC